MRLKYKDGYETHYASRRTTFRSASSKTYFEGMFVQTPGGYSHTLPIQVCAAQRGCDFEAPDLKRGIHFRGVF